MNPHIGILFEDSKLSSQVEKTICALDLVPVILKKSSEAHHLCISDSIPKNISVPLVLIRKSPPEGTDELINSGRDLVWFSQVPDLETLN